MRKYVGLEMEIVFLCESDVIRMSPGTVEPGENETPPVNPFWG